MGILDAMGAVVRKAPGAAVGGAPKLTAPGRGAVGASALGGGGGVMGGAVPIAMRTGVSPVAGPNLAKREIAKQEPEEKSLSKGRSFGRGRSLRGRR